MIACTGNYVLCPQTLHRLCRYLSRVEVASPGTRCFSTTKAKHPNVLEIFEIPKPRSLHHLLLFLFIRLTGVGLSVSDARTEVKRNVD